MYYKNSRNNLFYLYSSILYIVVILCLWNSNSIVESSSINTNGGSTDDSYCPYQALPDNLNDLNFIGFNGEFHIHETFYYDFKNFQKSMTFTVAQNSSFRIYVAPHVVDIDLWLYSNGNTKAIAHTSDMGGDENLYAELTPGSYTLKFLFFGQNKATKLDCTTLDVEIAISPLALMKTRISQFTCPTKQTIPNIDFTSLSKSGKLTYDSDVNQVGTVMAILDSTAADEYTFVANIPFTLPSDMFNKFGVDVSLGFDFLTGGSLNILIQSTDVPDPTNLLCLKSGNCTMGTHVSKGHSIIKTVLLPGNYELWIYDQIKEKDSVIQPGCVPFSLFLDIQPAHQLEDFLNCPAYVLPNSFNEPGYLDDGGYMYFDEDVYLDLSVKKENVAFNLTATLSYFRVYIPDFRVDIDFSLLKYKTDGSSDIVLSSFKMGGEEEVNTQLAAGSYQITFSYFGKNADIFCDSYALEVAIIPASDFEDGCPKPAPTSNLIPGLANINSSINGPTGIFTLNAEPGAPIENYHYLFDASAATNGNPLTIATANFTIPVGSGGDDGIYFFESILQSSFVMADIRLVLTDVASDGTANSDITYVGSHDRNRHIIALRLYPGDFIISIQTPHLSRNQITYLPSCMSFTLSMVIKPEGETIYDSSCWGLSNQLPGDLNTPGYLATSDRVHLSGQYLIPPLPTFSSASTYHNFTVDKDSILRVYVQYNTIDVDLNLKENDKLVSWNTHFFSEEAMVYQLKKDMKYQLRIKYFHLGITSIPDCSTFDLEMVIAPSNENPGDACAKESYPPSNLIPTPTTSPWISSGQYSFNQNSTSIKIHLPFVVPTGVNGTATFRAVLSYDFIWNNLAIQLKSVTSGNIITDGVLGYNRHEIETTQLVPGSYDLVIYEPFPNSDSKLMFRNCVDFQLDVAIQLSNTTDIDKDTVVCDVLMFPSNLNSIGYMSPMTGYSLYFQENVLADVLNGRDSVNFQLFDTSMIRIYVPSLKSMDVNIVLAYALPSGLPGATIASSRQIGEDIIFVQLNAAKYIITFYYYGLGGPIPMIEDCPSFPVFISIAKNSDLTSNDVLTTACPTVSADKAFPPQIIGNTPFSQQYTRSMGVSTQPTILSFTTANYTHFYANLDYNDLIASMAMKLSGNYSSQGQTIREYYTPLYQGGEAFINVVIPPGSWALSIYDAYKQPSPNIAIQCAPFSFSYYLNASNGIAPQCDQTVQLPVDLSKGGQAYGGPQNANGEIRFSTSHILIPSQVGASKPTSTRISFINPTKTSYLRLLSQADAGNDIDFFIYPNSTTKAYIYSSIISLTTDNNVWKLDPQAVPYVLEIRYFKTNKKVNCNYFSLDLAISNLASIQNTLLCPATMPNEVDQVPPDTILFPYGKDVAVRSSNYFFSAERVSLNTNSVTQIFRYRMKLTVAAPTLLYANLGFDFLANDLNMVLSNVSHQGTTSEVVSPLSNGIDSIPLNSDSEVDIYNTINYMLDAGIYYLDISEDMRYNTFGLSNACHYFTFSLVGESQSSGLPPRITTVTPSSGSNLIPSKALSLNVFFSESFTVPADSLNVPLVDYINSTQAIYLQNVKSPFTIIYPTAAIPTYKAAKILVTFPSESFDFGQSFKLFVDGTKFSTSNGSALFTNENSGVTHRYTMLSCDCSGHGTCGGTNSACVCNDPWAGNDCSKCKVGYHGVGITCQPNIPCDSNSCNGHGVCTASNGYPECQCATGYNSGDSLCGQCAYGYQGYPKCVLTTDAQDTFCLSPIIPSSLDSIEYLGVEGSVHIQDDFYLDIASGGHDTYFTLSVDSLLRVYTEPHQLDVDLWLYNVSSTTGEQTGAIDHSITFNHEEVLLDVLSAGSYMLSFKYYNWGKVNTACQTFNLELAIDSLVNVIANSDATKMCEQQGDAYKVPNPTQLPDTIKSKFEWNDPSVLFLLPAKTSNKINYLWSKQFIIAPPTDSSLVALVDMEIAYQFLPGDLSLVIQSGNGTGGLTCKGSTDSSVSGCVYGDNELNRNVIHATLAPGTYTVWIYSPEFNVEATNMACAPFNFKTSFTFINDDEDYFNCEGEILPASFDNSQFLVNNYLHVQDLYLVDAKHTNISFTVSEECFIRVNGQQDNAIIQVSLYNTTSKITNQYSELIYQSISNGTYILSIESNHIASAKNFCPLINLEIAIEPTSTPASTGTVCPTIGKKTVAPQFSAVIPYIFENGTTVKKIYTADINSPDVVGFYTFTLTQVAQFYTAIASEFLRGDLRVDLYKKLDDQTTMLFIQGNHDYNYNWIQEDLDPATYVLKIRRPQLNLSNQDKVACIPFEFEFSLLPLSKLPQCPGEPIPLSWNTIRFLGTEGKMHYHSDNFVVPFGKSPKTSIPLQVNVDSVIRLYVDPHIVDIDIRLQDAVTNDTLISGSNLINTEESFVFSLTAKRAYMVTIQFWRWSANIPVCNTFSLEIAVAPKSSFPPTATCTNGGNSWPKLPAFTNDQYSFSSLDSGSNYYFQQSAAGNGVQSNSQTFTTKVTTNIHIQVGYNFLSGDLALSLSSAKNRKTYHGVTAPNRNILEVQNLPAGTYTLNIYEPYSTLNAIMSCSSFNFDFYIEPAVNYDQEDGFYHYLPTTLDSYAYLNYNEATHIQGEYMMFDGNADHNTVSFTLTHNSVIRVQASILPDDENDTYNTTMTPTITITNSNVPVINHIGSVSALLVPGQYKVTFGQGAQKSSNAAVDVELEIMTVDQFNKLTTAITSTGIDKECNIKGSLPPIVPGNSWIIPSPNDGSFYYSKILYVPWEKVNQASLVLQTTFTVKMPTLVYIQVGFKFILADLDMYITSEDINSLHLLGKANRNTNEINVVVPAGTYILTIVNPVGTPNDATLNAYCNPYHLSITLRNSSTTQHSDCSLFNAIPWDLSSKTGGSIEFGGPIDSNGNLRLYSDDFIAPSTSSTQNMTFTIHESTFVQIYTIDDLAASIDTDVFVHGTNQDQTPIYDLSLHGSAQHSSLFVADMGSQLNVKQFDITLGFKGVSKGSCPQFGMQVIMKPVSYLTNQLYCPKNYVPTLPTTQPTLDEFGTFNQYISSRMSGDYISKQSSNVANGQFEYYIDFTVTRQSRMEASLSFDSIANNFYLKLTSRTVNKQGVLVRNVIATGDWNSEASFGETSMVSQISNSRLPIGNYSIVIVQPKFQPNNYITSSLYGELCLPFTWSLTIMDKNQVYAGSVTPSNGFNLDPTRDLQFTIEAHSTFYDSSNTTVTCSTGETLVSKAFYLQSQLSSVTLYPTSVSCASPTTMKWVLTFSNSTLVPDNSYLLTLASGMLFDIHGVPAVLPPQHIYSMMDTSCSGNGGFKQGVCVCALGYTGIDCGSCAQSYHNINTGDGTPTCVSKQCTANYCGCDPKNNATCIQFGRCYINGQNDAVCACSAPYNGTTCNKCSEGYIGWPSCTAYKSCGDCGTGDCDHTYGVCKCPVNYQGSTCSECADGYSGSDCKKNGSGAIIALEVIGTLLAVTLVVGVAVWYFKTRYRSGVTRYKMLPKFDFDNDSSHTTKFPGLYGDDDNEEDSAFDPKQDKSINRSGGKTHVFSFGNMPSSAVDSDDDEDYATLQKNQIQNQKNNHLFDM